MKLFTLLLSIVLLIIGFSSCRDDDDEDKLKLLTEINLVDEDGAQSMILEYDSSNRITKLKHKWDLYYSKGYSEEIFTYSEDGFLEKVEDDNQHYEWFAYNGDSIFAERGVFMYKGYPDPAMMARDTLILNAKGLIIKMYSGIHYTLYEYDNNNLIEIVSYSSFCGKEYQSSKFVYGYDNSKSIFSNQITPKWYWVYKGGLVGHVGNNNWKTRQGGNYENVQRSYFIDAHGYPTGYKENEKIYKNAFKYKVIG
ncbi:hypothetical protein [Dysgonomonas sp. 520]|uniref:hypothetical protein n=1 Tax=Dysgonomonas sp. 520 TaxID=2302931 RepID=UPI0013D3C173|nr:hypothetical protein [Dysgonomonas sp. 520]NDW10256.1 hypothetical protein [Dysgonomonas sp. 520]